MRHLKTRVRNSRSKPDNHRVEEDMLSPPSPPDEGLHDLAPLMVQLVPM